MLTITHLESTKKILPESAAMLVTSGINQRWLTDFDYTDGYVLVTHVSSYLITDFRYVEAARAQAAQGFEVVMPPEGVSMLAFVGGLLSDSGATRLMIEDATLSVAAHARFAEKFAPVELVCGASALLDGLREIKDAGEIETMKQAQAITDAAFAHILGYINPDRTEVDVALELEFFMRAHGAESVAFDTIAVSGTASSMPHGVPRPVKLERGFLTMDFGARYHGYCSDMTRTVVIGKADAEMKRLYSTVLAAQLAAFDALNRGERGCRKLDSIAREVIDGEADYRGSFGHSLGHGVGMYIHEMPRLSQGADPTATLRAGQVFTDEPGIYLPGKYGCRIEDMITITADGEVYDFTQSPKELIEL